MLGVVVWSCTFHNTSQYTITGGMYLSSHWPPLYPCAIFFDPLPSDSVFFRQSYITLPPYPSLEWSAKHLKSPPAILHPSSSIPICNHMIFNGADRVRGRRREGRREKRGGSRERDEKCKNMEGWKKRKILRVSLREGRRETRGGRGEAYPPVLNSGPTTQ